VRRLANRTNSYSTAIRRNFFLRAEKLPHPLNACELNQSSFQGSDKAMQSASFLLEGRVLCYPRPWNHCLDMQTSFYPSLSPGVDRGPVILRPHKALTTHAITLPDMGGLQESLELKWYGLHSSPHRLQRTELATTGRFFVETCSPTEYVNNNQSAKR
jgi:hypothetical protein